MSFFGGIFGRAKPQAQRVSVPVRMRAKYDAAGGGDDARHWANADALSADAALSPWIRRAMRNRARYERNNNSYLAGISQTLACDCIGTGPRIQINTGELSSEAANQVERLFHDWAWNTNLPNKLRTMRESLVTDGEAFAMFVTNPALDGVQLDVRLLEAEMVATPIQLPVPNASQDGSLVDGIEFDKYGNIVNYLVLRYHPGSNYRVGNFEYDRHPASRVAHWFRPSRAGQHRGVPEVAPALKLFASLRRYTDAVVAAAETAADFAAFLHSNSPAAEVDEVEAFSEMPIEKRSMVTLPEGWNISQLKAEQPTSTYAMFKREIINEIGRCMQLPYNVAALDSSSYNYASGRMDHQVYNGTIRVYRDELERTMLDPMFRMWHDEALLAGLIPNGMPPFEQWGWQWQWDGKEHVDPGKEASAAETRLRTHTTTLAHEYAKQGKDWVVEITQRAKEVALMKELGLFIDLEPDGNYGAATPEEADQAAAQ